MSDLNNTPTPEAIVHQVFYLMLELEIAELTVFSPYDARGLHTYCVK